MTNQPIEETVVCSLCGMARPANQIRWFLPDAAEEGTLVLNWPETSSGDPQGVPYCSLCLAEQIADESEEAIG